MEVQNRKTKSDVCQTYWRNCMGQRIKTARKDKALTGERLSELCNINATYLGQIEGGRKVPSLPVFISICNQLAVSPTYLLEDFLTDHELSNFTTLAALWEMATPSQIKIVTAMVKSALENMECFN